MRLLIAGVALCFLIVPASECAETQQRRTDSRVENLYANVDMLPHSGIQMLMPGEFHGNDVKVRPSSGWVAMTFVRGVTSLRPVTLHFSPVHDPISEEGNLQAKTGVKIQASGPKAYFYLRGVQARTKVLTLSIDEHGVPLAQKMGFRGNTYNAELEILNPVNGGDGFATAGGGSKLVLRSEGREQELASFGRDEFNDGHISVLWVGDLDGDGRLDFLLDISNHYNVSNPVLFLSKGARVLVEAVASFPTVGC